MKIFTLACGAALVVASLTPARAQGPVRQGLRDVGGAAAQGARGVAQGAGQVVQGAGQVVQGAGQAAVQGGRAAIQGTGQVLRGTAQGVRAITPAIPWQGQAGANLQAGDRIRDARWRFQRHNGEWWYYSPEAAWHYHRDGHWNQYAADSFTPSPNAEQQYSTGYRGLEQNAAATQGHEVRTDAHGRQFICVNGQPVYLDESQQSATDPSAQPQGDQGAASPTPADQQQPQQPAAAEGQQPEQADQPPQQQPTQPQAEQPQAEQPQATQPQPNASAPAADASPADQPFGRGQSGNATPEGGAGSDAR
jgi:hypothetical protein